VHLGPAPVGALFLRVVTEGPDGSMRALNHFNKHGKGELVRRMSESGIRFEDLDDVLRWASRAGVRLTPGAPGELDLIV
jgi:hypothetical protein